MQRGDAKAAHALFLHALGLREALYGKENLAVAEMHTALYRSSDRLGQLREAFAHAELAAALAERALPPDHPSLYGPVANLGVIKRELGDLPGALALFERSRLLARKAQGPDGPNTLAAASNAAQTRLALGEVDKARAVVEDALAASRRARGDDYPGTIFLEDLFGQVLREEGRAAEAVRHHTAALARADARFGRRTVDALYIVSNLGRARLDAGDARGLDDVLEAARGLEQISSSVMLRYLAMSAACAALLDRGAPGEAGPFCQRALALAEPVYPPDHFAVREARALIAELVVRAGRAGKAEVEQLEANASWLAAQHGAFPEQQRRARKALSLARASASR
jgi:hypothetical protein